MPNEWDAWPVIIVHGEHAVPYSSSAVVGSTPQASRS